MVSKAVVLAGGASKRMGQDKAMLGLGRLSLLEHQCERLDAIFDEVYVSSKNNRFNIARPIIHDVSENFAPCFGLLSAIDELKEPFFVLPVDMPFVDEDAIRTILDAYSKGLDACVGVFDERVEPLIGVYAPSIKPKIEDAIASENYKLLDIVEASKVLFVDFFNQDAFMNINTPQDYEKAIRFLKEQ